MFNISVFIDAKSGCSCGSIDEMSGLALGMSLIFVGFDDWGWLGFNRLILGISGIF